MSKFQFLKKKNLYFNVKYRKVKNLEGLERNFYNFIFKDIFLKYILIFIIAGFILGLGYFVTMGALNLVKSNDAQDFLLEQQL